MNRMLCRAIALGTPAALLAALTVFACSSSTPSACDALVNCCQYLEDGTSMSCIETAQSGTLTNAQCQTELQGYVATGECLPDGGGPIGDGGAG